jgi:hypothetical protein
MKTLSIVALLAVVGAMALVRCGSAQEPRPVEGALHGELEGAPDWVLEGCNAYFGEKKSVICGVGSAGGTRNISIARSAAQGRARTEIARTLQVKVKAMLKDYQATVTGGEGFGTAADDEQYVTDVSKQVTDMSLPGTKLMKTWMSPKDTLFVLMALDVEDFKSALNDMKQLNAQVRQAIEKRAEKAFNELDKEVEKERAQ